MAEEVVMLEFIVTRGKTLNLEKIKWGFHCTLKSMVTFP
jgi:hypothetical protein